MQERAGVARPWLGWLTNNGFILGMVAMVLLASLWPELGKTGGLLHSELLCDLGMR